MLMLAHLCEIFSTDLISIRYERPSAKPLDNAGSRCDNARTVCCKAAIQAPEAPPIRMFSAQGQGHPAYGQFADGSTSDAIGGLVA